MPAPPLPPRLSRPSNAPTATAPATATPAPTASATPAGGLPQGSDPVTIDPANFTTVIDNQYWPMKPGSVWTYRETDAEGAVATVVVTVTNDTKKILGVTTVVVHDVLTEDGQVGEDTFDWYARISTATSGTSAKTQEFTDNGVIRPARGKRVLAARCRRVSCRLTRFRAGLPAGVPCRRSRDRAIVPASMSGSRSPRPLPGRPADQGVPPVSPTSSSTSGGRLGLDKSGGHGLRWVGSRRTDTAQTGRPIGSAPEKQQAPGGQRAPV
jgi:hypothetical protein